MIGHRASPVRTTLYMAAAVACLLAGFPEVSAGLPEVVQRIKPSVVAVGTYQKTRGPPFIFLGTGFAVDDGSLIATNAHVIATKLKTEVGEALMGLVHR